jgi:uncharacterized protein YeaO (DUF488 family)
MFKIIQNLIGDLISSSYAHADNIRSAPRINIKRIYDRPLEKDGYRILVERLWPSGVVKEDAVIDEWANELAPSEMLADWFDHNPYHWQQFQRRYLVELKQSKVLSDFVGRHMKKEAITLIYSTKYDKLTHALVLREFLEKKYGEV